jgi:hypothetical protein
MILFVEREHAELAERARRLAAVARTERLGGILDDRHAVLPADRAEPIVVGALAVEIDGHERGDPRAFAGQGDDRLFDEIRIDVPAPILAIDEHRDRADVTDRVRGRRERQRRHQHVVPDVDAEHAQRELESGGAARQRDRVLRSDDIAELGLEAVDVRTEWRDPVRVERLEHEAALLAAHVWRREVDPRRHWVTGSDDELPVVVPTRRSRVRASAGSATSSATC